MISHYFIDRPIFASVISIIITLAGTIAIFALPVAQYPEITPPTVQVTCKYPGANASVIADTVAAPIEQQVNGVEGMLYMTSQSANDGTYVLTVTFALGTDLDAAMVAVQNRASLATPQLPDVVQRLGVNVKKKSTNMLLAINFVSPSGKYDDIYMSNYATINIKDVLARLPGVGDILFLGERDYSMRIWLDPDRMATRNIDAEDVINAIGQQNLQVTAGQIGQPPTDSGVEVQITTSALGRLKTPGEFENIVVKTVADDGEQTAPRVVRVRDIARVELAAQNYSQTCMFDGMPSVGLGVYQRPGANAIDAGEAIRNKMKELSADFPEGLEYRIGFDTSPFIAESIKQVYSGLRDAIILVALVVLLFLQNWRAALIPLIAVPVAIVGTFGALLIVGFSINTLSLFGLVLAIGIVVDDAIVVVENVQRQLDEGHAPRDAARLAMEEVTGPVIAVAIVLAAVFIPCAFISGITGEFFRQFAITISVSMVISAVNSLTLSPALAALLLKPRSSKPDPLSRVFNFLFGWLFRMFNRVFLATATGYTRSIGRLVRYSFIVMLLYGGLLYLTYWSFSKAPQGFIPLQDKGWLLVNVELPDSASLERTNDVMKEVAKIATETKGVAHTLTVSGRSFLVNATASNYGSMFIILEPFEDRKSFDLNGLVIFFHLREKYPEEIKLAEVSVFPPPPVNGLGATGGFEVMVEDRTDLGAVALQSETEELIRKVSENPQLAGVSTMFRADTPQLYVDIDRVKARSMGVSIKRVSQALQAFLGSVFVNNFNEFGRTWQVNVQAKSDFRNRQMDVGRLHVRNFMNDMVPLGAVVDVKEATGPAIVTRHNMYLSASINGRGQLGVSSGDAIKIMDETITSEARGVIDTEWTGLSYMQIKAGNTAIYVFAFAVVFVFLVLAALYESWSLPFAIILVVPLGLLFSVLTVWAIPLMSVGIFTQIGFVVLVGLASKNAILIVEFAEQQKRSGMSLLDATLDACKLRFRPIVMTSCAFILGVVPLIVEGGAGAEMRRSLGIAVFAGMLGVTFFGIFLTPVFYFTVSKLAGEGTDRTGLQRLGIGMMSVLLGVIFGLLLRELSDLSWMVSMVVGIAVGATAGALSLGLRRRWKKTDKRESGK